MNPRISVKCDVLVIGGGIAGCATALQLARRGKKVTLLERDQAGTRASGINFGGVRQNGRDMRELAIAMRARAMWDELPKLIGFDGEFRATATCGSPPMTNAPASSTSSTLAQASTASASSGWSGRN